MRAVATTVAGLVLLVACERAQDTTAARVVERAIEKKGREARVEIDREGGSITVHLGDAIVPDDWPAEVPVPPAARRLRVISTEGKRRVLSVSAASGAGELEAWYRDALGRGGWTVEGAAEGSIVAHRPGRRLAAVFTRRGDRARGRFELIDERAGG